MKIDSLLKTFQYNLLRNAGVNINPSQLGLKVDSLGQIQGSFASTLAKNNPAFQQLVMPEIPVLPDDPTDTAAQQAYQNQLLDYQQQMQVYNQRSMHMMMAQFQRQLFSIQQALASQRSSDSKSSDYISGLDATEIADTTLF